MSLINDVLRDLDRRVGPAGHGRPAGVHGGSMHRHGRNTSAWLVSALVLLMLAGLAAAWYLFVEQGIARQSATGAVSATEQLPALVDLQQASELPVSAQTEETAPVLLTGASLSDVDQGHRLELVFDRKVEHRMEMDGRLLHLWLPGVQLDSEWPELVGRIHGLTDADIRQQAQGMELILHFATPVQSQAVMNSTAPGGAVFRLDLLHQQAVAEPRQIPDPAEVPLLDPMAPATNSSGDSVAGEPSSVKPVDLADRVTEDFGDNNMIRSPVQDRGESRARRHYRQAVSELRDNRIETAIHALEQALEMDADLHPARELLANVLTSESRTNEAMTLLERGLARAPEHTPFTLRLARLHVRQGNPESGVTVLERSLPASLGDGNYHALLAGLYQQTGQAAEAAAVYRDLVRTHSDQAVWWLGLGLSLEDADQPDRAAAAYRRARDTGNLDAELAVFVSDRIERLGN